jgi:cyclohexadieny/prephenate dehydrogenase
MGASLALALKKTGLADRITGYDLHPDHATTALSLGAIDDFSTSAEAAVSGAQLVVLCMPVGSYSAMMETIAPHLEDGAIITDIGSTKRKTIRHVEPYLPPHATFIPAHPIAGTEKVGPTHANADIFKSHLFLITPSEGTPVELIELVSGLWEAIGARPEILSPEVHDHIYAYMSHLPQMMAFATAPMLATAGCRADMADELFRRFIRIGRSDPEMWRDVYLENAKHLVPAGEYIAAMLRHMLKELRDGLAEQEDAATPEKDDTLLYRVWPKILASVLVTTVQQAEHQLERKLLRYTAGGFIDFSCPVLENPEDDLATISAHAAQVCDALEAYLAQQDAIIAAIADDRADDLMNLLAHCQGAAKQMVA